MSNNEKKLIELRTSLREQKKFETIINEVLEAKTDVEEVSYMISVELDRLDWELTELKIEMEIPDSEWDKDEN